MKSIKEILILVKEEYKSQLRYRARKGLCDAAFQATCSDRISNEEEEAFCAYLEKSMENQTVFYNYEGGKTSNSCLWMWKREHTTPRIEWLDKHIKLNP